MSRLAFYVLLLFIRFGLFLSQQVSPVTLNIVQGTPFSLPNAVDFHEPSGTLLLSENYPSGYPYNFDRILFDGTHVQFSTIANLTDEIYVAAVRSYYIYSLNQGFQLGDMFTGNGKDGQIMRIQTDANGNNPVVTNPWCTLPVPSGQQAGLLRGGLTFDHTGYWNGDLIVSTSVGKVYRVNATCYATLIGDCGQFIEGVGVIPNDPSRFGPYAANIVTGGDSNTNIIWTFASGQTPKKWTVGSNGQWFESVNFIFPFTNFWGIDKNDGYLLASSWQDWQSLAGEVLIGEEYPSNGRSGLYALRYNNATAQLYLQPVPLTNASFVPSHFEGATFAAAGINNIAPAVNVCFVGFWGGYSVKAMPYTLPSGQTTPSPFYGYNTAAPWSPNPHTSTPNVPSPQANHIIFYWSLTYFNVLFLTIYVSAPNSGTAGNAMLELSSVNLANSTVTLILQDDSPTFSASTADFPDTYYWNATTGNGLFQWKWGSTTSDGVILGPFPLYQNDNIQKGYCVKPRLLSSSGLDTSPMYLASYDPSTQTTTYTLMDSSAELCVYLCPQFCFLYGTCSDCTANSQCVWCSATQTCQNVISSSPQDCPGNSTTTTCPCSTFTTQGCAACTANSGCQWCCQNNLGSCVSAGQCDGTSYTNTTCRNMAQCSPNCTNGGQCVCSACQCPAGLFGADCSLTKDCLGVINGTATVDICGVCNGNGSECLGCDGKPYGINFYDVCGVCGGNGMECYHPCNTTNCTLCVMNEICAWCPVEGKCIQLNANETCQYSNESSTGVTVCAAEQVLTPAAIAGLSAGVIAAIVIAIVVVLAVTAGVSGRYIYVRMHQSSAPDPIVQNNPTYEDKTTLKESAIYEAPPQQSAT